MKPRVALCIWLLEIFREDNRQLARRKHALVKGEPPLVIYSLVAEGYQCERIWGKR